MTNVRILKYSMTVESLLEILTERTSQAFFYRLIDVHSVTNVIRSEHFFNKNVEYCE